MYENPIYLILFLDAPWARLAVSPVLQGNINMALLDYEVAIEAVAQWDHSKPEDVMDWLSCVNWKRLMDVIVVNM